MWLVSVCVGVLYFSECSAKGLALFRQEGHVHGSTSLWDLAQHSYQPISLVLGMKLWQHSYQCVCWFLKSIQYLKTKSDFVAVNQCSFLHKKSIVWACGSALESLFKHHFMVCKPKRILCCLCIGQMPIGYFVFKPNNIWITTEHHSSRCSIKVLRWGCSARTLLVVLLILI